MCPTQLPRMEEGQTCSGCFRATSPQHWPKEGRPDSVILVPQKPKHWACVPLAAACLSPWSSVHPNHSNSRGFGFVASPQTLFRPHGRSSQPAHAWDPTAICGERRKRQKHENCSWPQSCYCDHHWWGWPRWICSVGWRSLQTCLFWQLPVFFMKLLIVRVWVSITYLQMSGTNKVFVFYGTSLQLDLEVVCCTPTSWNRGNNF